LVQRKICFEKKTFALNKKTIVSASVTDPENDKFDLFWSSGDKDFGKGVELEWVFLSLGEKKVTVKATDANGNSSTLTDIVTVIEPDFGYAIWGDNIEIIQRSEKGSYMGNTASVIYHFLGGGYDRFYTFSDKKLVSGSEEYQYTPQVLQQTQYAIAWTLYEEQLNKLNNKFGEQTSFYCSVTLTGAPAQDGLWLINGAGIEVKFENKANRSNATLTVYRKGTTTVCYKTTYSEIK
jgi:hypothetical protein